MNRTSTVFAVAIATVLSASGLAAQEQANSRFGLGASTLGATAEYAYRFHPKFSIRGVAAGLVDIDQSVSIDGADFDSGFSPNGIGLLLDWHSGLGGLRMSGGMVYSTTSLSGSAVASVANPLTVGSTTLNSGELVEADIEFDREILPMLSVGYDQPIGERWVLSGEIGAMFNPGYDATVRVSGGAGAIPATDLSAEAATIEDELNAIGAYPYVSLMLGLKF